MALCAGNLHPRSFTGGAAARESASQTRQPASEAASRRRRCSERFWAADRGDGSVQHSKHCPQLSHIQVLQPLCSQKGLLVRQRRSILGMQAQSVPC